MKNLYARRWLHSDRPSTTLGAEKSEEIREFCLLNEGATKERQLTPNKISDSADENVRATSLHAATVRVKVYWNRHKFSKLETSSPFETIWKLTHQRHPSAATILLWEIQKIKENVKKMQHDWNTQVLIESQIALNGNKSHT